MVQRVLIINGPNLNRMGAREPEIYGTLTYPELVSAVSEKARELELEVDIRQSNSESEIIDWLHLAADSQLPVIMNPAAFTHYSYAIADACAMLSAPLIEVHISNPGAREEFRHHSVVTASATGVVAGFGVDSYLLALHALSRLLLSKA